MRESLDSSASSKLGLAALGDMGDLDRPVLSKRSGCAPRGHRYRQACTSDGHRRDDDRR